MMMMMMKVMVMLMIMIMINDYVDYYDDGYDGW